MRALEIQSGEIRYRDDAAPPEHRDGETRVRVLRAGVCATDLALARGYMGFSGIPGHEFVGVALDGPLAGERVVGEINAGCGTCVDCTAGDSRHCPARTVLGILGRSGAFAEELSLPTGNLHRVRDGVSTDAAVFVEPLAAAFEILDQVAVGPGTRALVAGDGRLGLLCAHVLAGAGAEVIVAGRHAGREELLPEGATHRAGLLESDVEWTNVPSDPAGFDLAVEATGDPIVLSRVIPFVRPRGTLVLKTTAERPAGIDLSPIVVHEIRVVGSRCGRFGPALDALEAGAIPVERLIAARYPLADGRRAFEQAARSGVLKVLLDIGVE